MQCRNAYIKSGINYILCKAAPEVRAGDNQSIAHAVCGNQKFCGQKGCWQLLPNWDKCPRLRQRAQENAGEQENGETAKDTPAKKKRAEGVKTANTAKGKIKNNVI